MHSIASYSWRSKRFQASKWAPSSTTWPRASKWGRRLGRREDVSVPAWGGRKAVSRRVTGGQSRVEEENCSSSSRNPMFCCSTNGNLSDYPTLGSQNDRVSCLSVYMAHWHRQVPNCKASWKRHVLCRTRKSGMQRGEVLHTHAILLETQSAPETTTCYVNIKDLNGHIGTSFCCWLFVIPSYASSYFPH